jgi:endonuclease/exonuclease/phosphatase family metal-dependent hydrolase
VPSVLSYNIRSLRDDPVAVARVIRTIAPDVVCLQEVPRFWTWRVQRRRLVNACGMKIAAGRRACGLAVFTAPHVDRIAREFHLLTPDKDLHRRALAIAVVEINGKRLIAASTHLDLRDEPRQRHAQEILAHLTRAEDRYKAPVVLAGDINEEPGGPTWTALTTRFNDAYHQAPTHAELTFPARAPTRRIDAIFTDPTIRVEACGVPTAEPLQATYPQATDHRPVLAHLTLEA